MDALLGFVKTGVFLGAVVLVLVAAAVIYGLRLHKSDERRKERDKILNASLEELVEAHESTEADGQQANKNPYSNTTPGAGPAASRQGSEKTV